MGRIFEVRKHKMFARYAKMSKQFARVSKEVFMAVKASGPSPENNPRLRAALANARSCNMPKDRVEAAIKKASSKDTAGYDEITYEGYGPHGVALVIDTQTDNGTRTVANVRNILKKFNCTLGTSGLWIFWRFKGTRSFSTRISRGDDIMWLSNDLCNYI